MGFRPFLRVKKGHKKWLILHVAFICTSPACARHTVSRLTSFRMFSMYNGRLPIKYASTRVRMHYKCHLCTCGEPSSVCMADAFEKHKRAHACSDFYLLFSSRAAACSYAALACSCSCCCSCSDFCFFWHWNIFYWYLVIGMVIIFQIFQNLKN